MNMINFGYVSTVFEYDACTCLQRIRTDFYINIHIR